MKIGPYRFRMVSYVHDRYMDKKYDFNWPDYDNQKGLKPAPKEPVFEVFLRNLEDGLQWFYNKTINQILDKRADQKYKIRIDNYDTWSMDHTLAHIIVPMLKQLHETKHGAPFVDDADVPEELKSTSAPAKENDYDIDDNHFKRWDWVLNEMIWAFEQKTYYWEEQYYKYEDDPNATFGLKLVWSDDEGRKAHQERMNNGFRLFGKYYEALWT